MRKLLATITFFLLIPFSSTLQSHPSSFADLVENLSPAVVSIASTTIVKDNNNSQNQMPRFPEGSPFDEFFKEYFDNERRNSPSQRPMTGLGSGFIIEKEGIIVTNNHVIEGADEITVIMSNQQEFTAELLGRDPKADLAVLKIDPGLTELVSVPWGDSEAMRVGDWSIAIGNPLGLGGTVTAGIISAISRDLGSGPYVKFLQTDASINRGNSGGPLFNIEGEVIGINSAIISQTGGSIGLGFAIPSNSAKKIVQQLKDFGRTKRGWLGVQIQPVSKDFAESLGLQNEKGAFISNVNPKGPSKTAGIEAGDVILKFNGIDISAMKELPKVVAGIPVGKSVPLVILRNGKKITLNVVLGELELAEKENLINKSIGNKNSKSKTFDKLGFVAEELTKSNKDKFKLKNIKTGILITSVKENSAAQEAGLLPGMVIVRVGQIEVKTVDVIEDAIKNAVKQKRKAILLLVKIENGTRFVALELK